MAMKNLIKYHLFTKNLNLDNCSKDKNCKRKLFLFQFLCLESFLMLPLKILYDAFTDRPKITEQKKTI